MTASAVASVSLKPLLVLVCVERSTSMAQAVQRAGSFALSVLAADQQNHSEHFADGDRPAGAAQFEGIAWHTLATGSPVLDGALAALDCRLWATYAGGDHVIVVGEVAELQPPPPDPEPLVYFRGGYTSVAESAGGRGVRDDADEDATGGSPDAHP